ncbi:hypothetical protein, partial [Streptomyces rochei]|uniref:hypothetical protein n=1 Tax=Streptomyces rochei TaxID=1928 RepID=UPI00362990F7
AAAPWGAAAEAVRYGRAAPHGRTTMTDEHSHPWVARDRLVAVAAAEGPSLRASLTRLAQTLRRPAERTERARKPRAALHGWNGYAPTTDQERDLGRELESRLGPGDRP